MTAFLSAIPHSALRIPHSGEAAQSGTKRHSQFHEAQKNDANMQEINHL
jgi:hypothetical protein